MTRNIMLFAIISSLGLGACTGSASTMVTADIPSPIAQEEPTTIAQTAQPDVEVQLSFESQTYFDEEGRFELQYPTEWNEGYGERQSRGYFRQLVSWDISESNSIEFRPVDGTYVQVTAYAWDPLNDLDAYMAQRLPSWTNNGWEVVGLEDLEIAGKRAVKFTLQSETGEPPTFFFWMELGDRYLEINGVGDFDIIMEIVHSIRL